MIAEVYYDEGLESTNTFLPQPEADGKGYYFIYTIKYAANDQFYFSKRNYTVVFKINGQTYTQHQVNDSAHQWQFHCVNTFMDVTKSTVRYLGYNYWPQSQALDCAFVNKPLYVIIDMYDVHGNKVMVADEETWKGQFMFFFSRGSSFSTHHCVAYSGVEQSYWYQDMDRPKYETWEPSDHVLICPLEPIYQSYDQELSATDGNFDRSFLNYPVTNIEVKPYKVRKIKLNAISHWRATYLNANAEGKSEISLSIPMYDVYGHPIGLKTGAIGDMSICSR